MVVVVVVLGVVLAVTAVLAAVWRSRLQAARHQVDALTERLESTTTQLERTEADASEARGRADEHQARAAGLQRELDELRAANEQTEVALELADQQVVESTERAVAAERAAGRGLDALGVWALESLRLDRLWREQLALGEHERSPFAATPDPTRSAVEILGAAAREGVGTPVNVDWQVAQPLPPGPGVRVLRAVEELLACARQADQVALTVVAHASRVVVVVVAEPRLELPAHLAAALQAAGIELLTPDEVADALGHDEPIDALAAGIPAPRDAPGWEAP